MSVEEIEVFVHAGHVGRLRFRHEAWTTEENGSGMWTGVVVAVLGW